MKKMIAVLILLLTSNVYATEKDIRNFYIENGTSIASNIDLFTVPEGKTFVVTTIYAFALNSSSVYLKKDNNVVLRFHPANDNFLNFDTGLSFPSGSKLSANFRSNSLTISGYLHSNLAK